MTHNFLRDAVLSRRMAVTLAFGFSSGLPYLATRGTLQAWLKDEQVGLEVIGQFALVGLPYSLKFLWAPLLDRYVPPFLGRRRGWILCSQLCLLVMLAALAFSAPAQSPLMTAGLAFMVSFFSATQDIILDAHRRDTLRDEELGFGSALFIGGYRVGMLVSGAAALALADVLPWRSVYLLLAAMGLVGVLTTFVAPEPELPEDAPRSLRAAIVEPLRDLMLRPQVGYLLGFILLYKLGDNFASSLSTPFLLDVGFTKTELAAMVKTLGLAALIAGGLLGGGLIPAWGMNRCLWIFGLCQALSILVFALLWFLGPDPWLLGLVVGFENLCFGMGGAAYAAFMASLCNKRFTATQYAVLSSIMSIPGVVLSAASGYVAVLLGWGLYFVFCAALAIPGMLLLLKIAPWHGAGLAGGQGRNGAAGA